MFYSIFILCGPPTLRLNILFSLPPPLTVIHDVIYPYHEPRLRHILHPPPLISRCAPASVKFQRLLKGNPPFFKPLMFIHNIIVCPFILVSVCLVSLRVYCTFVNSCVHVKLKSISRKLRAIDVRFHTSA